MKKGYMIGLALFAVCAFSAMGVASAFAASEWLAAGAVITKTLPAETNGEFILTDLKIPLVGSAGVKSRKC
jgi:predicted Na+-dependent transporter